MWLPVQVSVDGQVTVVRALEAVAKDTQDLSVPLSGIAGRLHDAVGAQLVSEGTWGGAPWKRLSAKYAAWKEARVPGLPKLVGIRPTGGKGQRPQTYMESGRMRASLLDPGELHVGTRRLVYSPTSGVAGYHEVGTEHMPARPPVELTPAELHEWDRIFVRWVNGLIVQQGLFG